MKFLEGKSPAERNKMILAIALGVLAFASIAFMFFSSSSTSKPKTQNANGDRTTRPANPGDVPPTRTENLPSPSQARAEVENLAPPIKVVWQPTSYAAPDAGRNIFAFYVAPVPTPTAPPTPTPTPTPPLAMASISPTNVFARTGDFNLEVAGDKFTPATAILVDNNPLPTRYINAQQLATTVPASMISNDGVRQVRVSTPDGLLYSLSMPLMVTPPPPVPNFLYVGIIGKAHYNDTAVLKDKSNPKELLNVQRGDVIGSRFRVTSISEREIALTDTSLKIRHILPFSDDNPSGQPTGTRAPVRTPLNVNESGIPGIPNVPRYTPPNRADQQLQEAPEEGEEIPGIPAKSGKP